MQKSVGVILVKLSVDFKKPFDAIPVMIAKIKKMYPENKLILFIVL